MKFANLTIHSTIFHGFMLPIISALALFTALSQLAYGLTVEDFLKPPELITTKVSGDGKYLASIWNVDKLRFVSVQDLTKPDKPLISRFGDAVIRPSNVYWANDNRLLVKVSVPYNTKSVRKQSEKDEDFDIDEHYQFSRLMAIDADGKNSVFLLQDSSKFSLYRSLTSIAHYLPDDPKHILMLAYIRERLSIYKVNIYTGESEHVKTGGKLTNGFMINKKGDIQYRLDHLRIAKAIEIFELDENSKWEQITRIYFDKENRKGIKIEDLAAAFEDELIYIDLNEQTGYQEAYSYNPKTKRTKVLISLKDKDVISLLLNKYSSELVGYRVEKDDVIRNQYFDKENQTDYETLENEITKFGFSGFYTLSLTDKKGLRIIKTNGQDDPGAFLLYDENSNQLDFHGFSRPWLKPQKLATPAVVNYKTRDGIFIKAFVLLPPNYSKDKPAPLVMLPHGGPHARDYAYYDRFAQFIATRGYIVMQPNFRGSSGYGKAFEEAGHGEWGGVMQDDLEDGVKFLVDHGYVNPEKICIVGLSYGGYAALMGTIKTPNLYKCAVSINGVTHLEKQKKHFLKKFKGFDYVIERVEKSYGGSGEDSAKHIARSPALQASRVGAPILLIAGTADQIVPYDQAKLMKKALKKAKKPFEFVKLKDTSHYVFYYYEDAEETLEKVESFLEKYLNY